MESRHSKFFISLICVIALTVALTFALKCFAPQTITAFWPLIILFFAAVNVVMHFMTLKVKSKNDINKTTHFHMIVTVVKLIAYLAIIATYMIKFPDDAKAFVVTFLMYYLCFTFFETFVKIKINN
jgi:predicted neutral ceramidase superfamily lipid hydrolase